ncbi:MAG: serine/threonine protein kinase [Prevotella sp.]|nr:serine/threonine protein kinase [Prevotella sp.]
METQGATCDTFRVKLYGKLHFLKRLKAEYRGDIRFQEALRKEFETGYRLEHPNLVRYISLDGDSILMEYVDGENLTQRLATQPDYFRKQKNADKFVRQLLEAVGYLHSHQVLHLDLKPDNILLTCINSDVKLIDLGCCYTDAFPDTTGHTDAFAAPEQLTNGVVDIRTDIYAIGRILECLPGHHKYNKVIVRCTAPDPAARYQTISDLQEALSARRTHFFWPVLMLLVAVMSIGYFMFTSKQQAAEVAESQKEIITEKPETIKVREHVQPVGHNNEEIPPIEEQETASIDQQETAPIEQQEKATMDQRETTPEVLGPIKSELSEEEKAFLSQPHLHIATSEEFERYKRQLDEYYREANAFLDDTANFQRYPSHISYLRRYQEIIERAREQIETDEWFCPLYKSPMNPISSYTRKYKEDLEHRAFVNGNKLP